MKRDFKGVWIPKEIWINKNLKLIEKVFLVEINSLDNADGCFAKNSYFAEFFSLKTTRVSQIINNLVKKGYINAEYQREGREVVKRVLTINCKNLFNFLYEPLKKSVRTPLKNCKDNNTINNTINNTYNKRFDTIWNKYPNRKGKKAAYKHYVASVKTEQDWNNINKALGNYLATETVRCGYVQNGSTWFNNWQDFIDYTEPKKYEPQEYAKQIEQEKARINRQRTEQEIEKRRKEKAEVEAGHTPENIAKIKEMINGIGKKI